LELLQQKEEGEDFDEDVEDEDEDESESGTEVPDDNVTVEGDQSEEPQAPPTLDTSDAIAPKAAPEIAPPTIVVPPPTTDNTVIETSNQEEATKDEEEKPVRIDTETIPKETGKEDDPVDSTFMAEVMSMFDGIGSSTSPKPDSGLGVDDDTKSSAATEYSDSDSEIEEGVIKRIHRTTILTSDLTISRV
jgi:hypothetical protein